MTKQLEVKIVAHVQISKVNNPDQLFEEELSQASIEAPTLEDDNQMTNLHKVVNSQEIYV